MEEKNSRPPILKKRRKGSSFYESKNVTVMESSYSKTSSKKGLQKYRLFLIAAAVLVLTFFIWSFFSSSNSVFQFGGILPKKVSSTLASTDDRVNVLLLGNSGGKHDGPDLTDSMIIASYHLKSKKVTMISVPRDLWVEESHSKVNALYAIGSKKTGNGLAFTRDHLDEMVGVPIHYTIRLDFDGFAKAIDLVEGIDVEVPKTFDDYNYPITGKESDLCGLIEKEVELTDAQAVQLKLKPSISPATATASPNPTDEPKQKFKVFVDSNEKIATGSADFACRFEHIHFDKGTTHLDGTTALKFVRSRMGTNGEGSDFARSRRQQVVIQAFRDKVLSLQTLANLSKISGLISTLGKSVETDIKADKYLNFYSLVKNMESVDSIVLGDLGNGKSVLINPPATKYGGAYVLIPPDGDFTSVKEFVKKKLDEDAKLPEKEPAK